MGLGTITIGDEAREIIARFDRVAAALRWKREALPHWFTADFSDAHRELQEFVEDAPAGSVSVVAAPRRHGKTSLLTVGEALLRALSGKSRFIVIGGATAARAKEFLAQIKIELEENEFLKEKFSFETGKPWTGRELTIKLHHKGTKSTKERNTLSSSCPSCLRGENHDVTIIALSIRQSWRGLNRGGRRPDLIILDDIETSETVRNLRVVKARIETLLRDIAPAMEEKGILLLVGNLFSRKAAITRLFEQTEDFSAWRRFRFDAEDSLGNPTWPEAFTREQLEKLKETLGAQRYDSEFMNRPNDEGTFVKPEDIKYFEDRELPKMDMDKTQKDSPQRHKEHKEKNSLRDLRAFVVKDSPGFEIRGFYDPSATGGEASDCQAFVTVARVKSASGPMYYVLDAFVKKCKLEEAVAAIYERAKIRAYALIGVEQNVLKDWLGDAIARAANTFSFHIPWRGENHLVRSKDTRIRSLAPLIEAGAIKFKRDQQALLEQLLYYGTPGMNDDAPDALAACIALWEDEEKKKPKMEPAIVISRRPRGP